MKTKFSIIGLIGALLYCCQEKSGTDLNENVVNMDSVTESNVEQKSLVKWLAFNRESDSIIHAAEILIKHQKQQAAYLAAGTQNDLNIADAQLHLDQIKIKAENIKDYEANTEKFGPVVLHTLDSLKIDYLQEKLKLEAALCEFREYTIP